MPTFFFHGAIESFAVIFLRLARLGHRGDRWRKWRNSNMLLKKERDSVVEIGRGSALFKRLHAVIPCRLMGGKPHRETELQVR